jgi:hypothetical protein
MGRYPQCTPVTEVDTGRSREALAYLVTRGRFPAGDGRFADRRAATCARKMKSSFGD